MPPRAGQLVHLGHGLESQSFSSCEDQYHETIDPPQRCLRLLSVQVNATKGYLVHCGSDQQVSVFQIV